MLEAACEKEISIAQRHLKLFTRIQPLPNIVDGRAVRGHGQRVALCREIDEMSFLVHRPQRREVVGERKASKIQRI